MHSRKESRKRLKLNNKRRHSNQDSSNNNIAKLNTDKTPELYKFGMLFELLPNEVFKSILNRAKTDPLQFRLINKQITERFTPYLSGIYGKNIKSSFFKGVASYNFLLKESQICLSLFLKNPKNVDDFNNFIEIHFISLLEMLSTKKDKTSLFGDDSQFTRENGKSIALGTAYLHHFSLMNDNNFKMAQKFTMEFIRTCHDLTEYITTNVMDIFLTEDIDKKRLIDAYIQRCNDKFIRFLMNCGDRTGQSYVTQYLDFSIRNNFGRYMNDKQRISFFLMLLELGKRFNFPSDFVFLFKLESNVDVKVFNKIFYSNLDYDYNHKLYLKPWLKKTCELHFQMIIKLLNDNHKKMLIELFSEETLKKNCKNNSLFFSSSDRFEVELKQILVDKTTELPSPVLSSGKNK